MGGGAGWLSARQKQQKKQLRKTSSKKATTTANKAKATVPEQEATTTVIAAAPAASVPSSTPATTSATAPPVASPRFAGVAITCGSFFSPFGKHQQGGLHPDDWEPASISRGLDLDGGGLAQTSSTPHPTATEEASSSSTSSSQPDAAAVLKAPSSPPSSSTEKGSSPGTPPSFRTATPIRGTNVAARAALYENATPNPPSPPGGGGIMGGPPLSSSSSTRLRHRAQRDFWERAFQASRDDDVDEKDGDDNNQNGGLAKKQQWLQSAFTPTGGGNMRSTVTEDDDPTEDLTEDPTTEDASYSYHSVSPIAVRAIATSASPPLTSNDDAWRGAYAVWHRLGLLSWKPSSDHPHHPRLPPTSGGVGAATPPVLPAATITKGITMTTEPTLAVGVDDADLFHDSLMHLDEENCAPKPKTTAASSNTTPVQQSREWHMAQSRNCPLLTVFGGNAAGVTVVPRSSGEEDCEDGAMSATPPRRPVTGPSGVLSPSQIYSNYVQAYTAYVQDRNSPEKARAHLEARRLLELSKKPLPSATASGRGGVGSVVAERLVAA